jgi:GTP-binding protein of the ras superfamily involved in termination of M-phase
MEVDSPMHGHDHMDPDESMNSTITQSTIQALPDYNNYHDNGQHKENQRPQTSYSDTGFSRPYSQNYQNFTPSSDADTPPRYNYNQPNSNSNNNFQSSQASSKPPSRPPSAMSGTSQAGAGAGYDNGRANQYQEQQKNPKVIIKVGMVGDAQIGKTSLMVKYVEGSWDEDYIQTLGAHTLLSMMKPPLTRDNAGVNFMEKTISIRNTEVTFSIWDLGGQREFVNMLPLVCNDAVAILFMFDLTRKSTLNSIKEWYRQGRGFNKTAIPFLVGTKYDTFVNFPKEEQEEISSQVCSLRLIFERLELTNEIIGQTFC